MPALIKLLGADGLRPVAYSAENLAEAATYEPDDGVYTVASTVNRFQVLRLNAHYDRLEDSAKRAGINFSADRERIGQALREMITGSGFSEARFRITVPRTNPEELILSIEPFTPPAPALIQAGTRCISAANSARHNAAAKTTDWMHARTALKDAMPAGIYETFLLDDAGYVLEGLGSNFYAIKDGTLYTADEHILQGISRQVVMTIAPDIIPIVLTPVHHDDLAQCSDCFLTSSTRGIIPVIEIDGLAIGDGKPGAITLQLRQACDAWVNANLEDL